MVLFFFNAGQKWYQLDPEEWHAIFYGLKDGWKFWKRTHIKYSEIDKLDEPDFIKLALKNHYHYYEVASDLPEDILLYAFILVGAVTKGPEAAGTMLNIVMKMVSVLPV
jgi:hypothetical protein